MLIERNESFQHKAALWVSLAACFMFAAPAHSESLTTMSAINKAGRQRMLTQRMVKAYSQIGLDVRADEAAVQLASAAPLFDAQLAELKAFAPNPQIVTALADVEARWKPFKEVIAKPYSRAGTLKLKDTNESLLAAAHRVVLLLQDSSGRNVARLVNISGRQRMLSQRIGKFYMLRELGFRDAEVLEGLEQAIMEFKGAHAELRAATENTEEIRALLGQVGIQWELLEHSIRKPQPQLALFVAMNTEKILKIMDEVTLKYEQVGERK